MSELRESMDGGSSPGSTLSMSSLRSTSFNTTTVGSSPPDATLAMLACGGRATPDMLAFE